MKNKLIAFAFLGLPALLNFHLTAVAQPVVTTLAVTGIGPTNAILNGTVNPEGAVTTAYYQLGLTTNYGNLIGLTDLPASNTTITLPGLAVNSLRGQAGANWTATSAPGETWSSIASSADGTRLAATALNYYIYTSTNSGQAWTKVTNLGTAAWEGIATSPDGLRLAAVIYGDGIFTSTNGGVNWTRSGAPTELWRCIAASANGIRLVAGVDQGGGIYTSTNSGATWTLTSAPATNWWSMAASADGTRLAAAAYGDGIFTSTNSGATWTLTSAPSTAPYYYWDSIASSADGLRLAAVSYGVGIYTSADGGVTWTHTSAPALGWLSITASADGMRLAAMVYGGGIYASPDGGITWTPTSATTGDWERIASSADGTQLVAVSDGGIAISTGAASSLSPATLYHYQAVGLNSAGTSLGGDLTFMTSPAAPAVTSLAASGVTTTSATLNGTVNPNAAATSAYFQYGLTTNYGSFSATNSLVATNVALSVSEFISGLVSGATYHFQLVAGNSLGISAGADLVVTTLAPPAVATAAASGVTAITATLNGTVNPNGAATTAYFQYGLTTAYGSYSGTNTLAATNESLAVSNLISGLLPGTAYHFQLVASNSLGANAGVDLNFTTAAAAPAVTTLAASGVTPTAATLNGTVHPDGAATTAYFQYGLTTSYGSFSAMDSLAATNTALAVSNLIGSLTPGTTYHFQLVASNSLGANAGIDLTLTTPAGAPVVTTLSASGITTATATLNGTVNPDGADTTEYFQYGLTINYGSFTATNILSAINASLAVSNLISGLSPGTTYHFRLVASNSSATSVGTDIGFSTLASAPSVITLAASALNASTATLNGTVNPNGEDSTAYFQYGLTTNYGSFTATNSLAATNTALAVSNLIGGLSPATLYHFQLVAGNGLGTNAGADMTLATPTAPVATTEAAIYLTTNGAMLIANVNPGGAGTIVYFQYGLTTNYGSDTPTIMSPTTYSSLGFGYPIYGLTPGTTYHYEVIASNAVATSVGADVAFTTTAFPPVVTTLAASGVNATNATLNGTVNPNGGVTAVYFQFGLTTNYGVLSPMNILAATNGPLQVAILITNLAPSENYHYQIVATNSGGTNVGGDLTFTTGLAAPTVAISAAGTITSTRATLHGIVDPNGAATTCYFQYGVTTNYGSYSATNSLVATNANFFPSDTVTNLTPGTTYYVELVASNSLGATVSVERSFTTAIAPPTISNVAVSGVTTTNAALYGTVNPNGAATKAYFRYGLTTNYGSYSATNALAATNTTLSVSNLIINLASGTTYHFELVAGNSAGTTAGTDLTFTTFAQAVNFNLNGAAMLPGGAFQFSFTNLSGLSFTVLSTTNLELPFTNWTVLGTATEAPPGQYQFTDPQATNSATQFYTVRSP